MRFFIRCPFCHAEGIFSSLAPGAVLACDSCGRSYQVSAGLRQDKLLPGNLSTSEVIEGIGDPVEFTSIRAHSPSASSSSASSPDAFSIGRHLPAKFADNPPAWSSLAHKEIDRAQNAPTPDLRLLKAARPAPPQVDHGAEALGGILAVKHFAGDSRLVHYAAIALFLCAGCVGLIAGLNHVITEPVAKPGRRNLTQEDTIGAVAVIAVCFGIAGCIAFGRKPKLPRDLWVCQDGLIVDQVGHLTRYTWADIDELYVGLATGKPYYQVILEGETFAFSAGQSQSAAQIGEYIETRATPPRLLVVLRQLSYGETVMLGPIKLRALGLLCNRREAPWSEIAGATTDQTWLTINLWNQPAWARIRYRNLSFPKVLLAAMRVMSGATAAN